MAVLPERIEPSELEGRVILIGITRLAKDGNYTQEQFAGVASIEDQQAYALVRIDCDDGKVREYPFDVRTLERAAPGEYRLRSTGEVITNPDFLMTWTVTKE
ncbi:hypothetical protein RCO27_08965 [Sphingosinicella sp. LHD-64]|uniref:hypothetical protein n=1 Tax=Sphingosinicella sp. LHD-64 TaxID=3072139 RepID=UPI00280C9558|nr:hypothetical protein [Sphingosinicella sp. LHD-64]MDQ8756359.1 hypothetical protein [Sphingosinicella sp. LHD-64]